VLGLECKLILVCECTTLKRWYITVLSMGRSNIHKYLPLAIALAYLISGDYLSLIRHIQTLL